MSERPVALVTGASMGIGEAFADARAERGYDLALAARSAELERVAQASAVVDGPANRLLAAAPRFFPRTLIARVGGWLMRPARR